MSQFKEKPIKILLADDHLIVRQGLQFVIDDVVDDTEIIQASSLAQIRERLKQSIVDFMILDAQFPDGNSLSIISEIKENYPDIKILVFSSFDEETHAVKFIQAGADGYLSKASEEEDIKLAVEKIINEGYFYLPLTQQLLSLAARNPNLANPLSSLSERELQIAEFFTKGFGNLEIANQLSLKQNTVSTFKKRIFIKLNIESLVELVDLMKSYHNS